MAANPVPTPDLVIETVKTTGETLLRCNGKITSSTTAQLTSTARALIPDTKRLVLDLTDVSYMDSSGLGALVGIYVSAKRANCELKLINLNQRIKEILRITRLGEILQGHEEYLGLTPD